MPPDEGDALYEAAVAAGHDCPALPFARGRLVLRSIDGLARRRRPGVAARSCSPSTTTAARRRTRPAGSTTTPRSSTRGSAGWTPCRSSAPPSTTRASRTSWSPSSGSRRTVAAVLAHARSSFFFIDGGHGEEPARADYEGWTPHVAIGGTLAIHDVFPDPADGGRPPYEQIFLPALESGRFRLESATGSLRVLRRVD